MRLGADVQAYGLGSVPQDWHISLLENFIRPDAPICYGILMPGQNCHGGVPVIKVRDIFAGRIDESDLLFTDPSIDAAYKRSRLLDGDILITIRGTTGRVALVPSSLSGANITQDTARVRLRASVSKDFVYYALQSQSSQQQVALHTIGQAVKGINIRDVKNITIFLPPTLNEQDTIATALSDVDALIAGLERLIAKKRDIKQAAMQQLLTGQTRLPGFTDEWECVELGGIGQIRGGNGFPNVVQGDAAGDYPFYKVSDMNNEGNGTFMLHANNWISETTKCSLGATAFPADSIIFAKVGAAIFLERKKILTMPSCIDNNLAALVLDKSRADVRFIHYALLPIKFGAFVSTTALPSLSGAVLANINLSLPPLSEQKAIATVLSDMDAELSALESRLAKTRAIKQGMMQELLTGRTRLV